MKKLFLFFPLLLVYLPTTSADGSTEAQPKKTSLDERFNTPVSKPKAVDPRCSRASKELLFAITKSLQEADCWKSPARSNKKSTQE